MKNNRLIIGVLLLLVTFSCGADELPYRLVGIVTPSDNNKFVLIESRDGKQKIYRLHDSLGDGTIVEISSHTIKVQRPDEDFLLHLAGVSSSDGAQMKEPKATQFSATRKSSRKVQKALHELLSQSRKGNEAELISGINHLLRLPETAWIVAVDGRSVTSPENGLEVLLNSLREGESPRLTLSGVPDLHEVRVFSEQEKSNK